VCARCERGENDEKLESETQITFCPEKFKDLELDCLADCHSLVDQKKIFWNI
jgi:hypothetical protein